MKKNSPDVESKTSSGLKPPRLEDIFENALECISRIDRQGNYLSVNSRYAETCGFTVDEMIGVAWEDTVCKEDLEEARKTYRDMIETGRGEAEIRGVKKNGDLFYMHIVMVRGLESSDSSVEHYCFMQDVTRKKQAEREVMAETRAQELEEKYAQIVTASPDAVFICCPDTGEIAEVNDTALALTGYKKTNVLGKTLAELKLFTDLDEASRPDPDFLSPDDLKDGDVLLCNSDGQQVAVSVSRKTIRLDGQQRVLIIARDITDRKSREDIYQRAMESLSRLTEENFFGQVATLLADLLEIDLVLITEYAGQPDPVLHSLAFYRSGVLVNNLDFPLEGYPGREILKDETGFYQEQISKFFSPDPEQTNDQSQLCIVEPLLDDQNTVIGHLVIRSGTPLADKHLALGLIQVFSIRIAVELQRTRSLKLLQDSEERLQQVASSSQSVIWEVDCNLVYTYVSPAVEEVLGYEPDEIIGTSVLDRIYPHDKQHLLGISRQHIKSKKPFNDISVRMFHKNGHVVHFRFNGVPVFDDSGNLLSVRGSSIDVSTEIHAHRELLEQEQLTRQILEESLDAYIAIDENGAIKQWNRQSEVMFGWSVEEAVGNNLSNLIIPYDQQQAHRDGMRNYLKTGEHKILNRRVRLKARHRDGQLIPVELTVKPIETDRGKIFSAFIRDLTSLQRHEELERARLEILEKIVQVQEPREILELTCHEIAQLYDNSLRVCITGISSECLTVLSAPEFSRDFIDAVDGRPIRDPVTGPCGQVIRFGKPVLVENILEDTDFADFHEIARKNSIAACWSVPYLDDKGQVAGCLTLFPTRARPADNFDQRVLEVTRHLISIVLEQEKQRRQLMEINSRYATAINISPDGIAITRLTDGRILEVNEGFCRMSGYSRDELIDGYITDFLFDEPGQREQLINDLVEKGSIHGYERMARRKDGTPVYWLQSSVLIEMNGEKCLFSIGQDITSRKQQELLHLNSNRILEAISTDQPLHQILDLIVRSSEKIDPEMMCSILLLDKSGKHLFAGAAPNLPEFYNQAIDGVEIGESVGSCGTAAFTGQRVIVADIETHPYWEGYRDLAREAGLRACWSQPIFSSDEKVLGTFAIYYPTARTPGEFEIELIQSQAYLASIAIEKDRASQVILSREETLEKFFNAATEAIVISRYDNGKFLKVNDGFEQITGIKREEILGRSTGDMDIWLSMEQYDQIKKELDYGKLVENEEMEIRASDGRIIKVLMSNTLLDIDGEKCVMSTGRDITEWRATQQALRMSEQRLHQLTMTSPDPIILTRFDNGKIIEVNDSFEKVTGYSRQEAVGNTIFTLGLWPGRDDAKHYLKVLRDSGRLENVEFEYRKKDRSISYALLSASVDEIGGELYVLNLARDIGERKNQQLRLEKLNSALLELGGDVNGNIQKLVATAGELLKGSFALFNRFEDGEYLHAVGNWNVPEDYNHLSRAEGNVCYEMIKSGEKGVRVIRDFHQSSYAGSSSLKNFPVQTYLGQVVYLDGQPFATLCVIYDYDYEPTRLDKELLGILVSALSREEARRLSDVTLVNITRGVSASTGSRFFEYLTSYLCLTMNADFATIGLLTDNGESVQTLAISEKGKVAENFEYHLKGTPCEDVINEKFCLYSSNVQDEFPDDHLLAEMNIEAYAGTPIKDSRGVVIGLIAVLFRSKLHKDAYFVEQPLTIFAARAEAELDRMRSTHALVKSEEKFRDAFGRAPTGIVLIDKEGNFFQANQTIYEILGTDSGKSTPTNLFNIIHPDDYESCRNEFMRMVDGEITELKLDQKLITGKGEMVWAELHSSPVLDDHGMFMFAVTHVIDVTDRIFATQRLERSMRALQVLQKYDP